MNQEKVLDEFEQLPPEAQRQVLDFIAFLKTKYQPVSRSKNKISLINQARFVGMWKDREDLQDSTTWVRNLRRDQWDR